MADDATIEELTRAVLALNQTLADGKTIDPKEMSTLDKALKAVTSSSKKQSDSQKNNTQDLDKNSKGLGRFAGGISNLANRTVNLGKDLNDAAVDIRENRESFTSLNPAIKLTGDAISKAGSLTGGVVDALGDALSGIPVVGGLVGGLVSGVGKITAALSEAAGNIINTVGPMLTAELERASKAYRQAGQVGALGADGLRGLANQAIDAGLSFSTFAGVINKTAPELVFALGNSADAAKTLASTSKQMVPFRRGLLALGVTVEQQNELTAGYIGLQARLNRGETRNAAALAQGSQNYIKNLTELSKLTGKSVSEQQKELDEQLSNVRAAAALRQVQAKLGGAAGKQAVENIQGFAAVLKKRAPNIAAGFNDALGDNLATPAARSFQQAVGSAGMEIIQQLKSGQINRDEALAKIQIAGAKRYAAIGGDRAAMAIGGLDTALQPVLLDLQNLTFGAKFGEQIGKVATQVDKTAKTTDGVTNSMITAQESMIRSAKALDELALQTTLPAAAIGIKTFTDGMVDGTKALMKYVGMSKEELMKTLGQEAGLDEKTIEDPGETLKKIGDGIANGALSGAAVGAFFGPIGAAIGGALGGTAGGIFAGMTDELPPWLQIFSGKEMGGPVSPNTTYTVGEAGPELLRMGSQGGTIIPNNQLPDISSTLQGLGIGSFGGNLADTIQGGLQDALAGNTTSFTEQGAGSAMAQASNNLGTIAGSSSEMLGNIGDKFASGIQNVAGPAMGAVGGGMDPAAAFFNSLPGDPSEYMDPVKVAGDDNMQNSLGEAQIARLDMLIAETERANYINTKLLQAARS